MSHVQAVVLCDEAASSSRPFMIFQGTEKEKEDTEKKHHGAVDESSSEQQFHKLDMITFVV